MWELWCYETRDKFGFNEICIIDVIILFSLFSSNRMFSFVQSFSCAPSLSMDSSFWFCGNWKWNQLEWCLSSSSQYFIIVGLKYMRRPFRLWNWHFYHFRTPFSGLPAGATTVSEFRIKAREFIIPSFLFYSPKRGLATTVEPFPLPFAPPSDSLDGAGRKNWLWNSSNIWKLAGRIPRRFIAIIPPKIPMIPIFRLTKLFNPPHPRFCSCLWWFLAAEPMGLGWKQEKKKLLEVGTCCFAAFKYRLLEKRLAQHFYDRHFRFWRKHICAENSNGIV